MSSTTDILGTKLHQPAVPVDFVPRVALLRQLERGRQRPLTLVSAPAGYGKSTLVSSWLDTGEFPSAWVSLDGEDNDIRQFLHYVLAAVENLFPDALWHTHALVDAVTLPPLPQLATSLINDLNGIHQDFILVLDDSHRIGSHPVYDLMTALLRHPPPSLHLVLVGRNDPPLPINALRAGGQVTEIRARELCFTVAETAEFLQHVLGVDIDAVTAASWHEKTEGWATALRLVALALGRTGDLANLPPVREWGSREAREYLFNEVLSRQPSGVRRRLLHTAILDRFCAPLCDAIEGSGEAPEPEDITGWDFIAWLHEENVFAIPLDTDNRWFRFHHLFRELLRNQLQRHTSPEDINALHVRACGWFTEEGLIEEALHHALAAGDPEQAGSLIAQFGYQLMNDQQWLRLERCLHRVPRDQIEQDPALLVLEAWLYHVRFDISGVSACVDRIATLNATSPPEALVNIKHVPGHLEILQGILYYMKADGERTLACSQRALQAIPPHHKRARLFADIFQLGAYQMLGHFATGLPMYQQAMDRYVDRDPNCHAIYLANLCLGYWIDANLMALQQTAECLLDISKEHATEATVAWGLYHLGVVHYHRNELHNVEDKLTKVIKAYYAPSPMNFANSAFALALTYQAQGKADQAREISRSVVHDAIETNNANMLKVARAFEAELACRQGHLTLASQWLENYHATPFVPVFRFYMPQLAAVKVLLAQHTTESHRQAGDLLNTLDDFLTSIHNHRFRIDVLALHALLHDARGEDAAAVEKLSLALALAEPGGFIRPFVDLGPTMAELLRRLIKQGDVCVDYIGQLLAAFREDERAVAQSGPAPHTVPSPSLKPADSGGLLTEREFEVLVLLKHALRNHEIAEKLFVSRDTVKTHLHHIYKKLNAGNRQEAVAKARALGLLPHL